MNDHYFAGLFDGEGYITAQHKSDYRGRRAYTRLLVGLGMTHEPAVRLMQERFGGGLHKTKTERPIFQWYLAGSSSAPALDVFARLCVVKAEQARLALRLCDLLAEVKVRGKRPRGSQIISDESIRERIELVAAISAAKRG